jgi:hypothetical protein
MNRLISIGLAIAVAPAILLAIGQWIESPDTVYVSELALFSVALPLGGLLVIFGVYQAAINQIRPLPLTQQATTKRDILEIRRISLKLWRCFLSAFHAVYVSFRRFVSNGEFWRTILHDVSSAMISIFRYSLSQIVPLLFTGALGLFVAGAVYLPIAFDHVARVLLTLGGMSLVYGSESIIRLGHVKVCTQIGFSAPTCIDHDLSIPALILWAVFYLLWIWRRRAKPH